jgi:hypothetical protein
MILATLSFRNGSSFPKKGLGIGVADSQILASAIQREAVFWTGDRNLMNDQNIGNLQDDLENFDSDLEYNYRIE